MYILKIAVTYVDTIKRSNFLPYIVQTSTLGPQIEYKKTNVREEVHIFEDVIIWSNLCYHLEEAKCNTRAISVPSRFDYIT